MSSHLLISPDGMLGRAWAELLARRGVTYDEVRYPAFDMTDPKQVEAAIRPEHRTVVNCAAWTDVDGAEADEPAAEAVNGTGVENLARRCRELGATLVHYSTDYVFDGHGGEPYRCDAPLHPINAYGRSKAAGELAIRRLGADHLIIRTSWLYAPWSKNFVRTIAKLAAERDQLRVVDDQRGRPTSAEHLAKTSLALLEKGARGCFHVCDGGECTWYELARAIAERVRPECHVEPCTTDEFPRPAPRPSYSVLDLSAVEALLGPMPHWTENLADVLQRLE